MKLKFEEITRTYADGVNIEVDLGAFVDAWMEVYRKGGSRNDVAKIVGISTNNISLVEIKVRKWVDLPDLKVCF
jgi:hypothetical protein